MWLAYRTTQETSLQTVTWNMLLRWRIRRTGAVMRMPYDVQQVSKFRQLHATIIAKTVRNALEELHGGGIDDPENGLTDAQMAKINPIVRNAVLDALTTFELVKRGHRGAINFVNSSLSSVPDYWEQPELSEAFTSVLAGLNRPIPAGMRSTIYPFVTVDRTTCKNCGESIFRISGDLAQHFDAEIADSWRHDDRDRSRGCRAASFDPDNENSWDDTHTRGANATPPRGWKPLA